MVSMSSWMLSMKMLLISVGVVSFAMAVKFSVPMAVNGIPALWSVVLSWMKPPYLYIIINGIIITIAASSRFHHYHSQSEPPEVRSEHLISVKTPPPSIYASIAAQPEISYIAEEKTATREVAVSAIEYAAVVESKPVTANTSEFDIETEKEIVVDTESQDRFFNPKQKISPEPELESLLPVREKPLVSSRFGHRRPIRTNPEVSGARALRVAKPKRHETLESTWRMITEGRHVPLTRHLKKSEPWEHHQHVPAPAVDHVPKPESLRKEASVGQEELNRRVEAFIKKFNDEMRMQRQESLNQYMEMINRGV